MPRESTSAKSGGWARRTLAAILCLAAFAAGLSLRGDAPVDVAAVTVSYLERQVPACGAASEARGVLTMLSAYLPREDADAVASIEVAGGAARTEWKREGGVCRAGRRSVPCPTEACREGACALRLPEEGAGPYRIRLLDRAGRVVGAGGADAVARGAGRPPGLGVERRGAEVEIRGEPGATVRISLSRGGRVSADVPGVLGADGRTRFNVPEGTDSVRASVSAGGADGVGQAIAVLPGPFDGGCLRE
jgi:hypothetical protein